eukprot:5935375-Pyramimonas_sp.AAC.2
MPIPLQGDGMESRNACSQCGQEFVSRSQMFKHLRNTECGADPDQLVPQLEKVVLSVGYIGTNFEVSR